MTAKRIRCDADPTPKGTNRASSRENPSGHHSKVCGVGWTNMNQFRFRFGEKTCVGWRHFNFDQLEKCVRKVYKDEPLAQSSSSVFTCAVYLASTTMPTGTDGSRVDHHLSRSPKHMCLQRGRTSMMTVVLVGCEKFDCGQQRETAATTKISSCCQ